MNQTQPASSIIDAANGTLASLSPAQRIEWVLHHLAYKPVLTSSFGIQSAVLLHMVTQIEPDIPVILIDTGYLFPQTYSFVKTLQERLQLNLQVYRPHKDTLKRIAHIEEPWKKGPWGLKLYNQTHKVEPLQRALRELEPDLWFSGVRRAQSESRKHTPIVSYQASRIKIHPIIEWQNRDVHYYLKQHNLPYHPLWDEGYVSVGDTHTSMPLQPGMSEEQTRFFGVTRECGIHNI